MRAHSIILSCAFLAIVIVNLPTGAAVTCAEEPEDPDCVDCTDELNADDPECLAIDDGDDDDDEEPTTTEATDDAEATTRCRRHRRRRYPGRRPGWRPGGWRGRRPTSILGRIIQKKMSIIG
ncbi:GH10732 [Drosophila grimshawi]|uniref:GH10732 n=1 Tax=Drosophila grimshawi TaxID=7222 RepID=B4JBS1_DROGR|nr:GH10732 [Drosophila grimshawi]